MTENWTGENLPPELVAILDERAGKIHSEGGSLRAALAEILNAYDDMRTGPTEWQREHNSHRASHGLPLGNYWFASHEPDNAQEDGHPDTPWQPWCQMNWGGPSVNVWFSTKAECEEFIRDEIMRAGAHYET
jgi:hypothetical protein